MSKKIVLIIVHLFILLYSFSQKNSFSFVLNGKITNATDKYIYLITYDEFNKRNMDSSIIINNYFKFTGKTKGYNNRVYIKLNKNEFDNADSINSVKIAIDNSNMYLKLKKFKFSKYLLIGCTTCGLLDSLNKKIANATKTQKVDSLENYNEKIDLDITLKYIAKYKKIISLATFVNNIDKYAENLPTIIRLYNEMSTVQKNTYDGLKIGSKISEYQDILNQIGVAAPDFTSKNMFDATIQFSSLAKNKYVLLDFWGSWCGPCRQGHPQLNAVYDFFKKEEFQIIGIACDENNKKDWTDAIAKDGLGRWENILYDSIQSIDSQINFQKKKPFDINYFPTKILIDKTGRIIARFEGVDNNLLEKLKSILKN
jgi:thiol-disulfide isomerase/thioredoxin